jgi:hypothetical protein
MKPEEQLLRLRTTLETAGHTLIDSSWTKASDKYHVVCSHGHDCYPTAMNVLSGKGPCRPCGDEQVRLRSYNKFLSQLADNGYTLVTSGYLGSTVAHLVQCSVGHIVQVYPGTFSRRSRCRVCYKLQRVSPSEKSFLRKIEDLGATPVYDEWLGTHEKYSLICKNGHACFPQAKSVLRGQGVCAQCNGAVWDRVYAVVNPLEDSVKFGITSGTGESRLRTHSRDGFTQLVYLSPVLPQGSAKSIEDSIRAVLSSEGHDPLRGREYFDASLTDFIKSEIKREVANAQQ